MNHRAGKQGVAIYPLPAIVAGRCCKPLFLATLRETSNPLVLLSTIEPLHNIIYQNPRYYAIIVNTVSCKISIIKGSLIAVQEFELSYHNPKTKYYLQYTHIMVTRFNFLNSNPAKAERSAQLSDVWAEPKISATGARRCSSSSPRTRRRQKKQATPKESI